MDLSYLTTRFLPISTHTPSSFSIIFSVNLIFPYFIFFNDFLPFPCYFMYNSSPSPPPPLSLQNIPLHLSASWFQNSHLGMSSAATAVCPCPPPPHTGHPPAYEITRWTVFLVIFSRRKGPLLISKFPLCISQCFPLSLIKATFVSKDKHMGRPKEFAGSCICIFDKKLVPMIPKCFKFSIIRRNMAKCEYNGPNMPSRLAKIS